MCPAILRPPPKYNSTNLEIYVPIDCNCNHLLSPHNVITKCPAISRTSPKYNSTHSKSSVSTTDLNNDCTGLSGDLNNKCAVSSVVSLTNCYFKTIFWIKAIDLNSFASWETWILMCRVSFPVSPTNGHCNTIFSANLYGFKELCLSGDLNNECVESSPVSLTKGYFKIILWVKKSSVSWETWSMSFPWCHWWMAISRPSFE